MTFITAKKLLIFRKRVSVLFLATAPFYGFILTWTRGGFTAYREILAVFLIAIISLEIILDKKWRRLDIADYAILFFILVAFVWLPFQFSELGQWTLGFRYDAFPLLLLFMARRVEWPFKKELMSVIFFVAAVVLIFGVLQSAVLPQDFLQKFGYSDYHEAYRPDISIASCQYLEHTDKFCRAVSTFAGPTRYGTYLLLILGLVLPLVLERNRKKTFFVFLGALALVNIFLTYSRSIWIGLIVMAAVGMFISVKSKKSRVVIALSMLVLSIAAIFVLSYGIKGDTDGLKTIIIRNSSTSEHVQLLKEGGKVLLANPFGIGVGKAGPASVRYEKFLTENWFLQIAVETGFIGVFLFLAVIFLLMRRLFLSQNLPSKWLMLSILGICVAGLFTHSFEETTVFLMLGILLPMYEQRDVVPATASQ